MGNVRGLRDKAKKERRTKQRLAWKGEPETWTPAMANSFISHSPRHISVSTFSLKVTLLLRHDLWKPEKSLTQICEQTDKLSKNFIRNYASKAINFGHWKQGIIFLFSRTMLRITVENTKRRRSS